MATSALTPARTTPKAAVALASASFGVIGGCLTLPGSLLPILVESFHIRLVEAGSMLALQSIGYLASVLTARWLIARFGARRVVSAGLAIFALGIASFGTVSTWIAGAAAMLVSGIGFGSMEVACNALTLALGGARNINLLNFIHLFFGVGSLATPAVVTRLAAGGVSWRILFVAAGVATMLVALSWTLVDDVRAEEAAHEHGRHTASRLVPFLLASVIGLYVGVEMGVGAWLTKFLVSSGASLPFAGNVLSSYWLGLAAGRFALTFVAHYVAEERLLLALAATSTVALTAAVSLSGNAAAVAFALTGAGYSGIFPIVIALGGRHQPEDPAGITSVLIAGAGIGGIVLPWLMSAISDAVSLTAGMRFYAAMTGLMTLVVATYLRTRTPLPPSLPRPLEAEARG